MNDELRNITPEDVKADDLPEFYAEVFRTFTEKLGADEGLRAMLLIGELYGGCQPYIPKLDTIFRGYRNTLIKRCHNGANTRQMAMDFGLTESSIRRIVYDTD